METLNLPLGTLIHRLRVDRTKSNIDHIHATKRVEYLNDEVVQSMPHIEWEEVELVFIPLGKDTSIDNFNALLKEHYLTPDPVALCEWNAKNPTFADKVPHGTQWNRNCCAIFRRDVWGGERLVDVRRFDSVWGGRWFACGSRPVKS